MKAHVLQHVPFEDIGSMASWLKAHEAEWSYTRFYQNPALPNLNHLDLVIAMGGPMSVNNESKFPWLRREKQFIRDAIARGVAVLGMCLGAQLIASALGCRVYPNPVKEIGWFPIEAASGTEATFCFPRTSQVFHWHGETFDLPAGAVLLARSSACRNQAFQIGPNVLGLQFHLEITPQSVQALVEKCPDDLVPGPYVQSASELVTAPAVRYTEVHGIMDQILSYMTELR